MVPQCAEGFGAGCVLLYHAACFLSHGSDCPRGPLGSRGDRARDAITDRVDSADSCKGRARGNRAAFLIESPMK